MSLTSEMRASFTKTIDGILATSDLNTISEKRIRKGIQATTDDDISPYKAEIKDLIMERFDIFNAKQSEASETPNNSSGPPTPPQESVKPSHAPVNGHSTSPSKRPAETQEVTTSRPTPPAKKKKTDSNDTLDSDAAFAARLQAEENLRARPTRGGATRKAAPQRKKATPKKAKTPKKIKAEDDSDIDSSDAPKEVKRTGGFHKPLLLSPALSDLLGETQLSRPQMTKKIWEYIKENDLQDPTDRRQIRCDDSMRAVFKQDKVHMFTMTKILNQNLYPTDE